MLVAAVSLGILASFVLLNVSEVDVEQIVAAVWLEARVPPDRGRRCYGAAISNGRYRLESFINVAFTPIREGIIASSRVTGGAILITVIEVA